jgi:hypothetical protein
MACKICDSPALPDGTAARDIVNKLLLQKVPYKQIQKITSFDKSLISRHSIKCITRSQANEIKSSFFKAGDSTFVLWPNCQIPTYLGPRDWIIKVQYGKDTDQSSKIKMMSHDEATALQLRMKTANDITPEQRAADNERIFAARLAQDKLTAEETTTEETADAPEELEV